MPGTIYTYDADAIHNYDGQPADCLGRRFCNAYNTLGKCYSITDTHIYSQINNLINPDDVYFCWDFDYGIDKNLYANIQQIVLINNDTNEMVELDLGQNEECVFDTDGIYNGGLLYKTQIPKLRRLELILKSNVWTRAPTIL